MLLGLGGGTQLCHKSQAQENPSPERRLGRRGAKRRVVPRRRAKPASCRIGTTPVAGSPALMADLRETSHDSELPHQAGAFGVDSGCLRGNRNGNRASQPGKPSMRATADGAGTVPALAGQRSGLAAWNRPCGTAIRRSPLLPAGGRFGRVRCVVAEPGGCHSAGLRQASVGVFPPRRASAENGHARPFN